MRRFLTLLNAMVLGIIAFHAQAGISFTVNIDDPSHVTVAVDYVEQTDIHAGNNTLTSSAYLPYLTVTANDGWYIKSADATAGSPSINKRRRFSVAPQDGATYTIVTGNADEVRTASFTIDVDDANAVKVSISDTDRAITLQNDGTNLVKFDPDYEKELVVKSVQDKTPLYQVKNGDKDFHLDQYDMSYSGTFADGDMITVKAHFPDKDADCVISFTNPGTEASISGVTVDGQPVSEFINGFKAKMGTTVELKFNKTYYQLNALTINGKSISSYLLGESYSFFVSEEMNTIVMDAEKRPTVNCWITVDNPQNAKIWLGSSSNNDLIDLEPAIRTQVEVVQDYWSQFIEISAVQGCFATVDVDGQRQTPKTMTRVNVVEGTEIVVSAIPLSEARDAEFTITVDDASKVAVSFPVTDDTPILHDNENQLRFISGVETPITIGRSPTYNKNLYEVSLDGTPLSPDYNGNYTVNIVAGSRVDVKANYPDEDVPVRFMFSNAGTEGYVTAVSVDGATVDNWQSESFSVPIGSILNFTLNNNLYYSSVDGYKGYVDINGEARYTGAGYIQVQVLKETVITINATKYPTYTAKVNIDNPENVIIYRGYETEKDILKLSPGINDIELTDQAKFIRIFNSTNGHISSVVKAGTTLREDTYGGYRVDLAANEQVDITTEAYVRDLTTTIYIDNPGAATSCHLVGNTEYDLIPLLSAGYTNVAFAELDNPFTFMQSGAKTQKLYMVSATDDGLTCEEQSTSSIQLAEDKVLKIYLGEQPQTCTVDFTISDESIQHLSGRFDTMFDIRNFSTSYEVLTGTAIDLSTETDYQADITVNDITVATAVTEHRLIIDTDSSIKITVNSKSGIEEINADNTRDDNNVYNLQGIMLLRNATPAQIADLPAGLYIINGRKYIAR